MKEAIRERVIEAPSLNKKGGAPLQTITCMGTVATQHSAPSLM